MTRFTYKLKKITGLALLMAVIATSFSGFQIKTVNAAASDTIRAISIQPSDTTDFGTENMKQALREIKAAGANYVTLIIPYYQANRQSTAMYPSWNTPTDESLKTAIVYAHSIGLKVMLKPHLETDYIEWRGNINPASADRAAWFESYTNMLVKYGRIAQRHGVEDYCIGTELLMMANPTYDSTNTANWQNMIKAVRNVYTGKLTYSANWYGELDTIEFWPQLDYIGISAYYDLYHAQSSDVTELKNSWDNWKTGVIEPIQKRFNKPVVFTELGYRSIEGAYRNPWDWSRSGSFNETDQVNSYIALIEYWRGVPWMQGVSLWRWYNNPSAGGQGDTDYTPQNKAALNTLKQYWGEAAAPAPTPVAKPVFSASSSLNPTTPTVGQAVTLNVQVRNTGDAVTNTIVDVEVYNSSGQRVLQKFYEGQSFTQNGTNQYAVPINMTSGGTYRVDVGVFNSNWTNNYYWGYAVQSFTVTSDTTGPTEVQVQTPSDGARVSGVVVFKAVLTNKSLSDYTMSWQVDGDRLNEMYDSNEGGPHKEAYIDFTAWNWKPVGQPYVINMVATDKASGTTYQKTINVYPNQ